MRDGECGMGGISLVIKTVLVEAGVAGEMPDPGSDGLTPGKGEEACRTLATERGLSVEVGGFCWKSEIKDADFGGSVIACADTTGARVVSGWVRGAVMPAGSLAVVSIFNCFAF